MWSHVTYRTRIGANAAAPVPRLVTAAPLAVQYTPDSVLANPEAHSPYFIGGRQRLATCSGVGWFHDHYIATVNLLGNAIHTYRFDPAACACTPVQTLVDVRGLARPENLAFSPDGCWLAITNSQDGAANVYRVDGDTHHIDVIPAATIQVGADANAHGVRFSRCGRYLAFTTVDDPGYVRLCRVASDGDGRLEVVPCQDVENRRAPLKAKGVAFSPDGRFVVLCYAVNASRARRSPRGLIAVHRFDDGIDERVADIYDGGGRLRLDNPDDVIFLPDGAHLVVTDQARDLAAIVRFDPESGALGPWQPTLANPKARLSFPHGLAVSADGRHLAITSYGDDKFTVYGVHSDARPR